MTEYLDNYAEENFSGFEGDQDMGMMSAYTGEGDDFLDFDGAGNSFANQKDLGRTFSLYINNYDTVEKKFVIFNGYRKERVSGGELFLDQGQPGYQISYNPSSINDLRDFLNVSPTTLGFIRINSSNIQQLEQPISLTELTPFKEPEVKNIFLQQYVTENTFRDNIVTVPTPGLILGSEMKIGLTVLPATSLTITFFFGGVFSNSSALKNKYRKAVSSIATVGLPRVLQSQTIRRGLTR